MFVNSSIYLNNKKYNILANKNNYTNELPISIVITSRNNNLESKKMTMNLIKTIKKFTKQKYSLWLIDNNSPKYLIKDFCSLSNVNFISIRDNIYWESYKLNFLKLANFKKENGSYNNALMLDLATKIISKNTKYLLSLHNDIIICHHNWLKFLISKLNDKTKVVSSMQDKLRIKARHVSTLLFDFQLFKEFNVNIYPKLKNFYSDELIYDVADDITSKFINNGYATFSCENTYNDEKVNKFLDIGSIFKNISIDKIFDNNHNLILAHLGRGYAKSTNNYNQVAKISLSDWNNLAERFLSENFINGS